MHNGHSSTSPDEFITTNDPKKPPQIERHKLVPVGRRNNPSEKDSDSKTDKNYVSLIFNRFKNVTFSSPLQQKPLIVGTIEAAVSFYF